MVVDKNGPVTEWAVDFTGGVNAYRNSKVRFLKKIELIMSFCEGGPMFAWGIVYYLMIDGWGVYTTWSLIASLINLTTALVYAAELDMTACCLAALSLLVIFHATWFVLENTVFDKYVRWNLTPYMVVIWASYGIRSTYSTPEKADVPSEIQGFRIL